MKTSKELREERKQKKAEMRALINQAKAEKRELNATEATKFDVLKAEVDAFEANIQRAETVEQMEARAAISSKKPLTPSGQGGEAGEKQQIKKRYSISRAIHLRANNLPLDGVEKEMHDEAQKEARERKYTITGVGVPSMLVEQRADLAAGAAPTGGATVEEDLRGFLPILRPRLMVESLGSTVLTGLSGNISIPKQTKASTSSWEGEVAPLLQSDAEFENISLSPKRIGSWSVFSSQLLAQSTVSIDRFVASDLERSIRIGVDKAAINGSGVGFQPKGILNTAGIQAITAGGAPTNDHLIDMETAIATADADMNTMNYLTTPGIRGKLKKTKLDAGSGQFVWKGNELNGYAAHVSTQVPSDLGGSNHAIIFGDFSQLILANWAGLDLIVDPYTRAKNSQVIVTVHSFWDFAVRYPEAFAAIVDATV